MAVYISGDAGDIFSALTCVTQKTNIYIYVYIYTYENPTFGRPFVGGRQSLGRPRR